MKTCYTGVARALARLCGIVAVIAACYALADPPIRIQCVGDSTTVGYTDNPVWSVQFDFGYRLGLYKRLTEAGYSIQYVGESWEPWTGEYGLPRFIGSPDLRDLDQDHHRGYAWLTAGWARDLIVDWMEQDDPDVMLLMIGRIDFPYGWTTNVAAVQRSLSNLVQKIVISRPEVNLIVGTIAPYLRYEETLVEYNHYITDELVPYYASRGNRVTSVDQHANFLLPGGADDAIDSSLYADGWQHANTEGNDRIAHTWFEAIRAIYPDSTPPEIDSFTVSASGTLTLTWEADLGVVYQLERCTDLAAGDWIPTGDPIIATQTPASASDNPGRVGHYYYRVVRVGSG